MKKILFFSVVLLLSCGCTLFDPLPPGTPPPGEITRHTPRKEFDVPSAVNYMTTSLSIRLLTDPLPENAAALDCDRETLVYARMVMEELRNITGIREKTPPARAVLKTRTTEKGWLFILLLDGKNVWQEHLDTLYNFKKEKESSPVK